MIAQDNHKLAETLLPRIADPQHLAAIFARFSRLRRFPPGSDGQTLSDFAANLDRNLRELSAQILAGEYQFSPFIEECRSHPNKTIARATIKDTIVQKALALVVEPTYDHLLPSNSYAFRSKAGPHIGDALRLVVQAQSKGNLWIIKEDIRRYFESVDHHILLAQLREIFPEVLLQLYQSYLKAPRISAGQVRLPDRGLPVGSILANFLSNLYLRPLDLAMEKAGAIYLRYCDDILLFSADQDHAHRLRHAIAIHIADLGLELNPEKSRLLPPGSRFVHLGYAFHGNKIEIGPRALAKFKDRLRRVTTREETAGKEAIQHALPQIIARVNSQITGQTLRNWVRYFAYCNSDRQFRELDFWLRDRIRASLIGRWNRGNYRRLPTPALQALGLRSLVGEYYRWRHRHQARQSGVMTAIASREHLQQTLTWCSKRYWNPYPAKYDFTPGADRQTVEEFLTQIRHNLLQIQEELQNGTYRFSPFIEFEKKKKDRDDPRIICRATFRDTIVQRAIATVSERRFDHLLSDRAFAYRPRRTQYAAFGQALRYIRQQSAYWVVHADFASFLDTVDLEIMADSLRQLLAHQPELLEIYLRYLYNPRLRDGRLLPRTVGLPRGGILTPFLANLYLKPLDVTVAGAGFNYMRYADDIFVFASSGEEARMALDLLQKQAQRLHLRFSPEKTQIIAPGEEYECLGYRVRGQEVRVRPYALNRLRQKIRRITARRKWREAKVEAIPRLINKVRRAYIYHHDSDWAKHFCRTTSDRDFRELDTWIADRVRAAVTGRFSGKNHRLWPTPALRQMGLVSLVSRYYFWRRRIAKQTKAKPTLAP